MLMIVLVTHMLFARGGWGLGTCDCVVLVAPGTSGLHTHDQCSLSR